MINVTKEIDMFPVISEWDLAIDMYEKDDYVIVKMNLPGVDPDVIDVSLEGKTLHVSGERKEEEEIEDEDYYHKEIQVGEFERQIYIPYSVKENEIDARYQNGVLKVILPKKEKEESKKVKVDVK